MSEAADAPSALVVITTGVCVTTGGVPVVAPTAPCRTVKIRRLAAAQEDRQEQDYRDYALMSHFPLHN